MAVEELALDEMVLAVGCTLRVETQMTIGAVVQVAPAPSTGVSGQRREEWDTTARHHTYVDRYDNRCERIVIEPGETEIVYNTLVSCSPEPDIIDKDATEFAPVDLPDELLHFVMPSRFCLPDELGHEAWQRFGEPRRRAGPACKRSSTSCTATSSSHPGLRIRGRPPPMSTAPNKVCAATSRISPSRSVAR